MDGLSCAELLLGVSAALHDAHLEDVLEVVRRRVMPHNQLAFTWRAEVVLLEMERIAESVGRRDLKRQEALDVLALAGY